jgi:uncharacterized repeat protein (TIGR01451 family)
MSRHRWIFIGVLTAVTLLFLVAITMAASASAAALPLEPSPGDTGDLGPAAPSAPTTLTVSILSSPWAPLDSNDPDGSNGPTPDVLVVEAIVTNTGAVAAEDLVVDLNYNEDPGNNWILVDGETPLRTRASLGPGEAYHAYWFAAYARTIGVSHQYTVTASAGNAAEVATSDNYFGNPAPGETVLTRSYVSAGNSGIKSAEANVVVGVAYTVSIGYDLGNSPEEITFSPVGNSDFDASTTRLLGASVVFSNTSGSPTSTVTVDDRIYFPSVPLLQPGNIVPDFAEVIFRLLPLTPSDIEFCSYAAIVYQSQDKYDQFFCEGNNTVPISGTVSLTLDKAAHSDTVLQNEVLTYTLHYSNTGTSPLVSSWLWDDVDPAIGSIISDSVDPPADPGASNANRVAWDLGVIAPAGEAGSSGTLTFAILVDGNGQDLSDGTLIENNALFGVSPGTLPSTAALTSTITTTVLAPTIVPLKSDGLTTIGNGERLTYTLNVANVGSSLATGLIVSDVLPAETTLAGPASPPADSQDGQTLVWMGGTLGDLAPGASLTITIPVTVGLEVTDLTVLSNTMTVGYQNSAGHIFDPKTAGDETTVVKKTATIHGYVFSDDNGNGQQDAGEVGIPNVLLTLDGGASINTDSNGHYTFTTPSPGVHVVVETDPASFFSTTPNEVHVDVILDQSYRIDFGDAPDSSGFASIIGTVFEDSDGDGELDAGEPGIAGVTVTLDSAVTVQTDINGSYGFTTTVPGAHTVVETDPAGYFSTTPNEIHVDVTLGAAQTVNFGDAKDVSEFGNIHGVVFEDANGNGAWEAAEPGIAGVMVTLDGGPTTTTDMYGAYSFNVTVADVHSVVETDLAGYFSTTPNNVNVKVLLGSDYRVDFGDALTTADFASIHGTVFEDLDSSGTWDADEVGIQGVTVTLDSTNVVTTDLNGSYVFSTTLTGNHTVVETDLFGYFSTTPNTVTVDVSLGNGYTADFGDVPAGLAQCPADSYEEDDTSAQAAALSIGETQAHDFCDDPTDWQKFDATAGNYYTVTTSSWGQRVDTYLAIYDTDGSTQLVANDDMENTSNFSSQIVWRAPADGQYYVNVTSKADQTGFHTDYTVSIAEKETTAIFLPIVMVNRVTAAAATVAKPRMDVLKYATRVASFEVEPRGVIVHSCQDSYEIDDTWQQASPIQSGVPQLHSFDSNPLVYAADKDFVWFDIGAFDTVTFTVTSDTGTGTNLEIFDDEGISTGETGTNELVFGDVPAGRYYLGVSPTSMEYGCIGEVDYTLTADREPLLTTYLSIILKP